MHTAEQLKELQTIIADCDGCIVYSPLVQEINWGDPSFPLLVHKNIYTMPKDKNVDPFLEAKKVIEYSKNKSVYILIPGSEFDAYGTRHGRGGGWYDRFLSHIPREWLRIGVTTRANYSEKALLRESWDQPVDWIIVQTNNSWIAQKSIGNKSVI
jgi:5,10-methenyltetrahydrofolate synthetase